MRIYNGTNAQVNLPYNGGQRITVEPKSVSGDILSSTVLITSIVTAYTTDEIALIVSGPFEINVCANIPTSNGYIVQSLDEAIKRFTKTDDKKVEPVEEEKKEEVVVESEPEVEAAPDEVEETKEEEAPVVEETPAEEEKPAEEPAEAPKPKKKKGSKKSK